MKRSAFTLVELLVVIAIIGLLSTVAAVSLDASRSKARYARALGDMEQIAKAAELYYDDNGSYPADVGTGVMPGGMSSYVALWPKPPCSGWTYDWENWSGGDAIEVTLRKVGATGVFYYGINCVPSASPIPCGGGGGAEITSLAGKSITCNE